MFDLIVVSTAWHWFKPHEACQEFRRILKPDGFVVIVQYTYLESRSSLAKDTISLVLKYNPGWPLANVNGCDPLIIDQLVAGDLFFLEQFCYDHPEEFSHEKWLGRIRTCNGVGSGSLTSQQVQAFNKELGQLMQDKYPHQPIPIYHRVFAVIAQNKLD